MANAMTPSLKASTRETSPRPRRRKPFCTAASRLERVSRITHSLLAVSAGRRHFRATSIEGKPRAVSFNFPGARRSIINVPHSYGKTHGDDGTAPDSDTSNVARRGHVPRALSQKLPTLPLGRVPLEHGDVDAVGRPRVARASNN